MKARTLAAWCLVLATAVPLSILLIANAFRGGGGFVLDMPTEARASSPGTIPHDRVHESLGASPGERTLAGDGNEGRLRVRVLDEENRPLEGIVVRAEAAGPHPPPDPGPDWDPRKSTTSEDGRAELHLPRNPESPEWWSIQVNNRGPQRLRFIGQYKYVPASAAGLGEEEFVLAKAPERNSSLWLYVKDDLGVPLEGMIVSESSSAVQRDYRATERRIFERKETCADGSVFFDALPSLDGYSLFVGAGERARKDLILAQGDEALTARVDLKPHTVNIETVTVPRLGKLTVTLTQSLAVGSSATVKIRCVEDRVAWSNHSVQRDVQDGQTVIFEGVKPGKWEVRLLADAMSDVTAARPVVTEVVPGEDNRVAMDVRKYAGIVSGHVRDVFGQPVENALVEVSIRRRRIARAEFQKSMWTGADGWFELRGVPERLESDESYHLYVGVRSARSTSGMTEFRDRVEVPVLLAPQRDLEIRVFPSVVLEGVCRDATTGELLKGVDVKIEYTVDTTTGSFRMSRTSRTATEDGSWGGVRHDLDAGWFRFRGLCPGRHEVWVVGREGGRPSDPELVKDVMIPEDARDPIRIEIVGWAGK